jgi:ribonuclease-3
MEEKAQAARQAQLPPERQRQLLNLAGRLGYRFQDLARLDQALRHSSFAHENPEAGPSNEQMEFLGDAVLALTVSNLLLQHFPESSEGELSRSRAALVNARRLAALARDLDLGAYLLLGRGEEVQAGREKPSLLADALEAVMAAVFLDGGLKAAESLTQRWFTPLLAGLAESPWQDFKTRLQELIQARHQASPTYHLLSETGPSHARVFEVEVCLGERPLARGQGRTKKQAEQQAAKEALEALAELTGDEAGGGEKPPLNAD